jgi:hypothetical protein
MTAAVSDAACNEPGESDVVGFKGAVGVSMSFMIVRGGKETAGAAATRAGETGSEEFPATFREVDAGVSTFLVSAGWRLTPFA